MSNGRFAFCLAVLATGLSDSQVSGQQSDHIAAVQSFSVGGVHLGSTVDELKRLLPTAVEGRTHDAPVPRENDYVVTVNNGTEDPPKAFFRFMDGVVATITIEYSPAALKAVEKTGPIKKQLATRFGEPTREMKGDLDTLGMVSVWQHPESGRWLSYWKFSNGTSHLFVRKYSPEEANPKTSILGFDELATTRLQANSG